MTTLWNRHYFNPNFTDRKLGKQEVKWDKQCQHLDPDRLSLELRGLNHHTSMRSRVKDFQHEPNKSKALYLHMAWLWSGSHSGSCTWTLWTSLLLSPDFKGKLWRAALSLLSGSVENTEEKEGEVFLRRKLWCNCRWSRYFFADSSPQITSWVLVLFTFRANPPGSSFRAHSL